MKWNIEDIKWAFSGRLMCSQVMKEVVCNNLLSLPPEIIEYVTNNVWFVSSPEDAWAFTFRGSDIAGQYLIFLSDELLKEDKEKVNYTILHEIGHVILQHRNSMGYRQSEKEVKKQEKSADQFARKYH